MQNKDSYRICSCGAKISATKNGWSNANVGSLILCLESGISLLFVIIIFHTVIDFFMLGFIVGIFSASFIIFFISTLDFGELKRKSEV